MIEKNKMVTGGFRLAVMFGAVFFAFTPSERYILPFFAETNSEFQAFFLLILGYFNLFLADFFSPWIIGRLGTKWALILGALTYTIVLAVVPLQSFILMIPAAVLMGWGAGLLWNATPTYFIFMARKEGRNPDYNLGQLLVGFGLGSALGLGTFAFLSEVFGLKLTFWWVLPATLLGAVGFLTLPSTKEVKQATVKQILRAYRQPILLRLATLSMTTFMLYSTLVTQLPLALQSHLGNSMVGYLSMPAYLCLFLCLVMDKFIQKWGKAKLIFWSYIVLMTSLFLLILADLDGSLELLVSGSILACLSFAPLFLSMLGMADLAPERGILPTQGVTTSADDLAVLLGLLFAALLEHCDFPLSGMYYLTLVMAMISLHFIWPLLQEKDLGGVRRHLANVWPDLPKKED